jgi:hypothetical protein
MNQELDTRLKADFIRKKLSRGWNVGEANLPGKFLYILARIPDETLIFMDRKHAEETAKHTALMQMYRNRPAQDKPKESPIAKAMRACLVTLNKSHCGQARERRAQSRSPKRVDK